MVMGELLLGALLSIFAAVMSFAGPLVIKYILVFIKDQNATMEDQTQAFQYVTFWAVLYFLRIFVKINADNIFARISTKAEQILSVLVLAKILKLSSSYKKYLEKGDMINHLINDVFYVRDSIQTIGLLFEAPATLIAVQCFLFAEAGIYGFSLVVVFIIGAIIQYFLESRMSKIRIKKLGVFEERVGTNLELLGSIKHLKLLGWEQLLPLKNLDYLHKENKFNNVYFLLNSIFELIINVFPTLTILIMFVIEMVGSGGGDYDTVTAYTMISVVSMIYSPAKQLFGQIIRTIDGNNALKRISHLL
jgi:ABC-type multidrug transport system fused ATPase/permease subunit